MFWSKRTEKTAENEPKKPDALPTPPATPAPAAASSTTVTAEAVREILRKNVHDPEIGINVVDLGLIYDIQVSNGNTVNIKMTLTSPGCPVGPQIISAAQTYVHRAYPDLAAINVHVVWDPLWNPEMMSQEAKDMLGFF